MGQKTNPIIFQINKTKQWKANYTEKKSTEFYLYTLQQLEIKKFINNFFSNNKLKIKECKINYTGTSLNIYISYYQYKSFLNKLNNIQKTQKIKLVHKDNFKSKSKKKRKKKIIKILKVLKIFKNKNTLYNFNNYNDLIYLKKLSIIKKLRCFFLRKKRKNKLKRLKLLTRYKQLIELNKYKDFNNFNNFFLESFFNSLNIFLNKKIKIAITLKPLNIISRKNIKKKEHYFIKNTLIKLKKYEKLNVFKEGVNLVYIALKSEKSAELLAHFISMALQKNKKHNFFLRFLKACIFKFRKYSRSSIISIKIEIKGRFNRARRSRKRTYKIGQRMSLLTLNSKINYSEDISVTSNGTFGIKVWVFEKNVNWTKKNKIQKNKKR